MLPGNYTLTYNTSNSDGVWFDDRERKLEITILSPWWKRWWAYLLYILIASGILYYYYRFRIAQIKKKEAFKRKEAEFLQKEAEYKQLVAETETAILRLQMNPHFIFNSMNSISSYILQKDIETANNYLLRFAKLMRMILNFAEKPLIAVSEEMELLEQYLKTETMRFEKKFKYSFEVAEEFDPDEFLIPTMILQPFVENAIWHGMANKLEGEGKILIKFWIENDSLNCSVQDNGIGRSAANKKLRSNDHKSKAISITHRRLEMIQPKDGIHASLEIKDLKDESKKPSGTLVLFRFPIF
jgi:LytS/YehU family sensor histidine kinase